MTSPRRGRSWTRTPYQSLSSKGSLIHSLQFIVKLLPSPSYLFLKLGLSKGFQLLWLSWNVISDKEWEPDKGIMNNFLLYSLNVFNSTLTVPEICMSLIPEPSGNRLVFPPGGLPCTLACLTCQSKSWCL